MWDVGVTMRRETTNPPAPGPSLWEGSQKGAYPHSLMTNTTAAPSKKTAAESAEAPPPMWTHRSLLGLQELSADELRTLLGTAAGFAEVSARSVKKVPALRGKVVANLFFEDSTRTRLSFTLAKSVEM